MTGTAGPSRARAGLLALVCAASAACAGGERAPAGFETTDSAGVVLVRNPAEPADSALAPRLVPDLRIGVVDGPVEYQFTQIVDVEEGSRGQIYVLDLGTVDVRVFDAEGTYVRTIGRQGEGPGEFTRPTTLRIVPGDTLLVLERGRLHVFAPDGTFAQVHTFVPPRGVSSERAISPAGDIFMEVNRSAEALPGLLLRLDRRTLTIDTISELLPATSSEAPVALGPTPKWTILDDGRIVIARSDEYRFVVHHAEGAVERVVTRDVAPLVVPEPVKAEMLETARSGLSAAYSPNMRGPMAERLRQQGQNTTIADHYPHFLSIEGGPRGSLWARHFPPQREPDEPVDPMRPYEVFDAEGRHLGAVKILVINRGPWARGEHIYQVVQDELGVSYLERLRIEWGEGG